MCRSLHCCFICGSCSSRIRCYWCYFYAFCRDWRCSVWSPERFVADVDNCCLIFSASIAGVYCGGNPHKAFEITLGDDQVPTLWAISEDSPKLRNAKCFRKRTISGETEPQTWTIHDGGEYPPTAFGWGETTWMEDKEADACLACKQPFHTFFRRHHCRSCGKIFCWEYVQHNRRG